GGRGGEHWRRARGLQPGPPAHPPRRHDARAGAGDGGRAAAARRRGRPRGAVVTRSAVMGSGSWGTAFAMVLADAGGDVVLWGKDGDLADTIERSKENPAYHPG